MSKTTTQVPEGYAILGREEFYGRWKRCYWRDDWRDLDAVRLYDPDQDPPFLPISSIAYPWRYFVEKITPPREARPPMSHASEKTGMDPITLDEAGSWHPENWDGATLAWLKTPDGAPTLALLKAAPDLLRACKATVAAYNSHQLYDKCPLDFLKRTIAKAERTTES
jgi:hypothetical protein